MTIFNKRVVGSAALTIAAVAVYVVQAQAAEASASGEVRRVDAQAGKITIKHGAISDLGLPAMILVYHAAPELLEGVEPGDKIKFTAKREANQYVVTSITK